MKTLFATLLFFFSISLCFAQKNYHTIKFKNDVKPFKANFKFSGIIDKRPMKENIGYVRKGLNNRRVYAKLEGEFETTLADIVNKIIEDEDTSSNEVFFFINEFNIDERMTAMKEKGICRIEIEFAKQEQSTYFSLGKFSSVIEEGGIDVTQKHDERIMKCLRECIVQFEQSDWANYETTEIFPWDESNNEYENGISQAPIKGMYGSFENMIGGQPMEEFPIVFSRKKFKSKSLPKYDFKVVNKEDKDKSVMFISNGTDLFMHASRYSTFKYFIKSKYVGKYSYFEDRVASATATYLFGVTGTAISAKNIGIILDTSNGEVFQLTKANLYEMLKDHKEILTTFKKSKKKKEDMEKALVALNKKLSA